MLGMDAWMAGRHTARPPLIHSCSPQSILKKKASYTFRFLLSTALPYGCHSFRSIPNADATLPHYCHAPLRRRSLALIARAAHSPEPRPAVLVAVVRACAAGAGAPTRPRPARCCARRRSLPAPTPAPWNRLAPISPPLCCICIFQLFQTFLDVCCNCSILMLQK
jgi:hypothetical protein